MSARAQWWSDVLIGAEDGAIAPVLRRLPSSKKSWLLEQREVKKPRGGGATRLDRHRSSFGQLTIAPGRKATRAYPPHELRLVMLFFLATFFFSEEANCAFSIRSALTTCWPFWLTGALFAAAGAARPKQAAVTSVNNSVRIWFLLNVLALNPQELMHEQLTVFHWRRIIWWESEKSSGTFHFVITSNP
jgi:hypothetical protein